MENHPVPRQITTFEFKLIGFLTLRQFAYLAFFAVLGFIAFMLVPTQFVNILLGILVGLIGVALAFVPFNGRPLDVWIKNFTRRLFSPSQYFYHKKNTPPEFLAGISITSAPHDLVRAHIDARHKLSSYVQTHKGQKTDSSKKNTIYTLIQSDDTLIQTPTNGQAQQDQSNTTAPEAFYTGAEPFLFGVVRNTKNTPLPNILVYIKDQEGRVQRILKSNHNGVFATYHTLPQGEYMFEVKDLGQKYFFDTMDVSVEGVQNTPITIYSKEVI